MSGRHRTRRATGLMIGTASAVVAGMLLMAGLAAVAGSSFATTTTPTTSASASANRALDPTRPTPVYAYFYQWFTASSWNRAKSDLPLRGRYSSDDPAVLREQVRQARAAGIDGFLTSWKSTVPLNRRLDRLVSVAAEENLDLGVVYEALDFERDPLPIATVEHDMVYLVQRWGSRISSRYYGRPVIIWTGTERYSTADVLRVRQALDHRAILLAAAKTVDGYVRLADIVDGEAYYWSSSDPTSSATTAKLSAMSEAVHAHGGLWFAPAAPGFDGTTLGGTRVIPRDDGRTLSRSLDNAFASSPDAVAVISWNEWSENTYIEPGELYGDRQLTVLTDYLAARAAPLPPSTTEPDSSTDAAGSGWSGARAGLVLLLLTGGAVVWLGRRARRPRDDAASGTHSPEPQLEDSSV
ncbi:MAG TPA: endo-1,3-alpha-glucanase family glycosylhydrolase [Candidatus Nanopelagicales bacterium]|nr:endo-1,3-alpha-glucanase family glycosylhydrolase [Candidatus Nanopelagicales bacterium]